MVKKNHNYSLRLFDWKSQYGNIKRRIKSYYIEWVKV